VAPSCTIVNAFDSTADVDCRTPANEVLPTVVVPDMFCVFDCSAPRSATRPVTSFWANVVATRRRLGSTRTGKFGVRLVAPMEAPYIASEPSRSAFKFGLDWRNLDIPPTRYMGDWQKSCDSITTGSEMVGYIHTRRGLTQPFAASTQLRSFLV